MIDNIKPFISLTQKTLKNKITKELRNQILNKSTQFPKNKIQENQTLNRTESVESMDIEISQIN